MKQSILCAIVLSFLALPAMADEVVITPVVAGAIQINDSRRAGYKTRKHFYQIRGIKTYTYLSADGKLISSEVFDSAIPDKRSWEKRHPILSTGSQIGMVVGWAANACGLFR